MTITGSELTRAWNNVDGTSYATASISPAGSALLLFLYSTRHGTTGPGATPPSAYGGTWTELAGAEQVDGISAIGGWWLITSASPGTAGMTVTIDGGVTAIGMAHSILQFQDIDTASPIKQAIYGPTGTTSTTIGLAAAAPNLADANNAQVFYGAHRLNAAPSNEAGWTAGTAHNGTLPNYGALAEWKIASFDSTPTMTIGSARWQSLYVEVAHLVPPPPSTANPYRRARSGLYVLR